MDRSLTPREPVIHFRSEFDPMRWPAVLRLLVGVFGLALVARAVSNHSVPVLLGLVTHPVVRLRRTIEIAAPREDVFDFWRKIENFSRFMSYVKDVRFNNRGGMSWTLQGPGGVSLVWAATLGAFSLEQGISWKSVPDAPIHSEGRVLFRAGRTEERTLLDIELGYAPPIGMLGFAAARILGFDPRKRFDGDLLRMKELVEKGSTTLSGTRSMNDARGGYLS